MLVHVLYFCFPSSWPATAAGFLADPASEGAAGTDHTDQQAEGIWNRDHISPKREAVVPAAAGPGTGGPCQAAEWDGQYTGTVIYSYMGELRICSFLSVLTTGRPSDVLQWPDCTSAMKVVAEIRHTQFQHDLFFLKLLNSVGINLWFFFPSFRLGKWLKQVCWNISN